MKGTKGEEKVHRPYGDSKTFGSHNGVGRSLKVIGSEKYDESGKIESRGTVGR